MRTRIYRSLDATPSLFGLKGSYILWFVPVLGAVLFLALMVGSITSSILGTLFFLAGAVVSYFGVLTLQGRYSEKDLRKVLVALRMHSWIMVKPLRFRSLWN